ncbi:hypothetical protein [Hyphobacterium sp.]|uniref:hypothetical protein n=1 Tax=Hyphobacterium sp. TaxID=2004662 RepID=UPI003B51A118
MNLVSAARVVFIVIFGVFVLTSCGRGDAPASVDQTTHDDMDSMPIEFRVAFMSGHVETGLALYRAGVPDEAAPHLLHPVSEAHAAEREGIDALGLAAEIFERVSQALDDGRPASEIEPMLVQAEANLALLQANAGGDSRAIIAYLMDVTDAGEYQDAFGFATVARQHAQRLGDEPLIAEIDALVGLWPAGAPLAASTPAPVDDISARIAEVRSIL